jgi:hypothetical protein
MDVTTALKIKADTKEVQKAGQVVKQAFSPVVLSQFSAATKALGKQMSTLAQQMAALNKLMVTGAQQATAAYKALAVAAKGAGQAAAGVGGGAGRGGGGGAGAGTGGGPPGTAAQAVAATHQNRNSFVAGLAQGLGVAEYIPTEPGMGYRIGGAMVGRGVRAMAAPFLTPGVGGVAQALSALPGGGIAGVGLQAAAGAVQTRIGYERLVHQGLFAGAGQWRGQVAPQTAADKKAVADAERGLRIAEYDLTQAPELARGADVFAKAPTTRTTETTARTAKVLTAATKATEKAADAVSEVKGAIAVPGEIPTYRQASGKGLTDMTPDASRVLARQTAETAVEKAQTRLDTASARHRINTGAELGLSPTELVQMRNQFMQARGGKFEEAGPSGAQFQQAMVGQIFGVNAGVAGAFARGGMPGGGGGQRNLMDTMADAIVTGMDGSILAEYMDTLVGLQQQAEQRGLKIDPEAFTRLSFGLTAAGIAPLQNKRLTAEFAAAPMNVAERGIDTPADMFMLRAIARQRGIDISTPEGFFTAKRAMQEPEEGDIQAVMAASVRGSSGYGKNTQVELIQSLWKRFGVKMGPTQVDDLVAAAKAEEEGIKGKGASVADQIKLAREKALTLPQEARDLVKEGAPTLRTVADLERLKVDLGRTAADAILGMEKNSTRAGTAMGDFSEELEKLNEVVGDFIGWLRSLWGGDSRKGAPGKPTGKANK